MLRCPLIVAAALVLSALVPLAGQSPTPTYRVDVTVTRTTPGGSPQVARYTLDLQSGPRGDTLTLNERIPISNGKGDFTYQPVGTSLRCHLQSGAGGVELNLHADLNRVSQAASDGALPRIDAVVLDADTIVPLGQEVTLATASGSDPGARYSLSARVTASGR